MGSKAEHENRVMDEEGFSNSLSKLCLKHSANFNLDITHKNMWIFAVSCKIKYNEIEQIRFLQDQAPWSVWK